MTTDPPAALFDGEDVDTGESAPEGLDLTATEVEAILAEAGRLGTEASTDEAN